MTMAKGFGNGMAIGAVVDAPSRDASANDLDLRRQPVATPARSANARRISSESLQLERPARGELLREGLEGLRDRHDIVGDVRGKGLMIGVELVRTRSRRRRNRGRQW